MDRLIQRNWGIFPRSSVISEALRYFLHHASSRDLQKCRKRKVNILFTRKELDELDEVAKANGANRTDLIRYTIRKVVPLFAEGSIVESI